MLVVVDYAGNINSNKMAFLWNTSVLAANAGTDQVTNATFTQNGSVNNGIGPYVYKWSKVSGPGNITFGA